MKTTLNINDKLLIEAKAFAARERTSLTKLIEQGLRLRLRARARPSGVAIELPVSKDGRPFPPDINPCSNRSLLGMKDDD